jgi:acyl carrier protein
LQAHDLGSNNDEAGWRLRVRWSEDMQAEEARFLIADHLGVEFHAVRDDARFVDDLGADSLDLVQLAMRFEEALGISIEDHESEFCTTVANALDLLHRKIRSIDAG